MNIFVSILNPFYEPHVILWISGIITFTYTILINSSPVIILTIISCINIKVKILIDCNKTTKKNTITSFIEESFICSVFTNETLIDLIPCIVNHSFSFALISFLIIERSASSLALARSICLSAMSNAFL